MSDTGRASMGICGLPLTFMLSVTSLIRSTNFADQVTDWLTFSEPSSAAIRPSLYFGRCLVSGASCEEADCPTASLIHSCWVNELNLRNV